MGSACSRAQLGMTLTELMVAVAVSLLATIAIFQTFAVAEGHRRTATSGGDAAFGGMIGMHVMQRDLRAAGYGLNSVQYFGCRVIAHDAGGAAPRDFDFTLAPVLITQGAGNAADAVTIVYSSTDRLPAPIRLGQTMANADESFKVINPYGIFAGDLVIAAQVGLDCSLAETTLTPSLAPVGQRDLVPHLVGSYTRPDGHVTLARYNKVGGLGVLYTLDGVLLNVGPTPVVNRYSIGAAGLVVDQPLVDAVGVAVAANAVQLQAQYGRDTTPVPDAVVDVWDEATPANADEWSRVLAVRLGIAVRSPLPERPDPVTGNCNTTTQAPTWTGGTLDVTTAADWRCYRYRVFEGTSSLRNLIWRPE